MSICSVLMRWREESIEDGDDGPSHELMIHMLQPCLIHSYSRDQKHGPCCGHDTFYQLDDCSSSGVQYGVMVGMICFNVNEVEVGNNWSSRRGRGCQFVQC